MLSLGKLVTALAATSLGSSAVTLFLTAPKLRGILDKRKREGVIRLTDLYEDQDGVSNEELEKAYRVWPQKSITLFCAIAGTALSLASAVRTLIPDVDYTFLIGYWLFAGSWVCQKWCLLDLIIINANKRHRFSSYYNPYTSSSNALTFTISNARYSSSLLRSYSSSLCYFSFYFPTTTSKHSSRTWTGAYGVGKLVLPS